MSRDYKVYLEDILSAIDKIAEAIFKAAETDPRGGDVPSTKGRCDC